MSFICVSGKRGSPAAMVGMRRRLAGAWGVCAGAIAMTWLGACAAQRSRPGAAPSIQPAAYAARPAASAPDTRRLEQILDRRTEDGFGAGSDFALGPGDVIEISVPLEQLERREVRVSSEDTIALPLVGEMSIRGMTERQLTDALRRRLSKYMHNPPVVLFVKSYGSREVAVTGAVEKPGLYTLKSGSDTLMDMISRAGGVTREASASVVFVPAAPGESARRAALFNTFARDGGVDAPEDGGAERASSGKAGPARTEPERPEPAGSMAPDPSNFALSNPRPITIQMNDPRMRAYLDMPARPGDVLMVPSAGEVTVGGWVQSPGAYKVTPGMTALSAISAAGGPLFSWNAEVLRADSSGERISIPVDISAVQKGREPDVPVRSGDVVMIDRSVMGAAPYAFYEVFTKFGAGMYMPVP